MSIMMKTMMLGSLILLFLENLVSGQSCPPNTAMGLCQTVAKPCFVDNDCSNGEICCPQACSRSCKPWSNGQVSGDGAVPDLLNDPRVYVGKCPQASCYDVFNGEPDQCGTSNLCREGQFCCNDGCKNVCQWKPEYAARIAQQEARAKQQQHLIIQKQQEEMRRRQHEMHVQRQRQLATADLARQQAEARAAAEAELAAQQVRAKFEAGISAAAAAQSKAVSALQQRMADLQVNQQRQQQPTLTAPAGSFLDNFVGEAPSASGTNSVDRQIVQLQSQQRTTASVGNEGRGYLNAKKRDNLAGSITNQIHSPANINPYGLGSQQSISSKDVQRELLALIQPPPPNYNVQYPTGTGGTVSASFPQEVPNLNPRQQSPSLYLPQRVPSTYQAQSLSSAYPTNPARPIYPAQNYVPTQQSRDSTYQASAHTGDPSVNNEQAAHDTVNPLLMYHAMQTAA